MVEPHVQAQDLEDSKDELRNLREDTIPHVKNALDELETALETFAGNPSDDRALQNARHVADSSLYHLDNTSGRGIKELNHAAEELVGPAEMMSSWADTDALADTLSEIFDRFEDIYFTFTYMDSNVDTEEFVSEMRERLNRAQDSVEKLESELFKKALEQYPDESSLRRDMEKARNERERQRFEDSRF